jgi:hypothetical protein
VPESGVLRVQEALVLRKSLRLDTAKMPTMDTETSSDRLGLDRIVSTPPKPGAEVQRGSRGRKRAYWSDSGYRRRSAEPQAVDEVVVRSQVTDHRLDQNMRLPDEARPLALNSPASLPLKHGLRLYVNRNAS